MSCPGWTFVVILCGGHLIFAEPAFPPNQQVSSRHGGIQLQANDSGRPFSEPNLQRLAVLSPILGATLPGFRHLA